MRYDPETFSYTPGREAAAGENLRAIPSRDLYCTGVDAIRNGQKVALSAGELEGLDQETGATGESALIYLIKQSPAQLDQGHVLGTDRIYSNHRFLAEVDEH
jgi:hypothetical protein